jgi:hypothetical protein
MEKNLINTAHRLCAFIISSLLRRIRIENVLSHGIRWVFFPSPVDHKGTGGEEKEQRRERGRF